MNPIIEKWQRVNPTLKGFLLLIFSMLLFYPAYWVSSLWILSFFVFFPIFYFFLLTREEKLLKFFWFGLFLGTLFLLVGLGPLLSVEHEVFGVSGSAWFVLVLKIIGFILSASLIFGSVFGLFFALIRIFSKKFSHAVVCLCIFPVL